MDREVLRVFRKLSRYMKHREGCTPDPAWIKDRLDDRTNKWQKRRRCSCGLVELRQLIRDIVPTIQE